MNNDIENNLLNVTDDALKRIAYLTSQGKTEGNLLRIEVDGGGCSGFEYHYKFEKSCNDDDIIIKNEIKTEKGLEKVSIAIDPVSAEFLEGSTLEYIKQLGGAHFKINNPKASATCGCGNSFSL